MKMYATLIAVLAIFLSGTGPVQAEEPKFFSERYRKMYLSDKLAEWFPENPPDLYTLYCEKKDGEGVRVEYDSCKALRSLQKKGCYGLSTLEIKMELWMSDLCDFRSELLMLRPASSSFFDLDSEDWWREIPAELIPLHGGVYNDELWDMAVKEHRRLTEGKRIGDILASFQRKEGKVIEGLVGQTKEDCGLVFDKVRIEPLVTGDVDGDGARELSLKIVRLRSSSECELRSLYGSMYTPASATYWIKKTSKQGRMEVYGNIWSVLSFKKAYRGAKDLGLEEFWWRGKLYNTK